MEPAKNTHIMVRELMLKLDEARLVRDGERGAARGRILRQQWRKRPKTIRRTSEPYVFSRRGVRDVFSREIFVIWEEEEGEAVVAAAKTNLTRSVAVYILALQNAVARGLHG